MAMNYRGLILELQAAREVLAEQEPKRPPPPMPRKIPGSMAHRDPRYHKFSSCEECDEEEREEAKEMEKLKKILKTLIENQDIMDKNMKTMDQRIEDLENELVEFTDKPPVQSTPLTVDDLAGNNRKLNDGQN